MIFKSIKINKPTSFPIKEAFVARIRFMHFPAPADSMYETVWQQMARVYRCALGEESLYCDDMSSSALAERIGWIFDAEAPTAALYTLFNTMFICLSICITAILISNYNL